MAMTDEAQHLRQLEPARSVGGDASDPILPISTTSFTARARHGVSPEADLQPRFGPSSERDAELRKRFSKVPADA